MSASGMGSHRTRPWRPGALSITRHGTVAGKARSVPPGSRTRLRHAYLFGLMTNRWEQRASEPGAANTTGYIDPRSRPLAVRVGILNNQLSSTDLSGNQTHLMELARQAGMQGHRGVRGAPRSLKSHYASVKLEGSIHEPQMTGKRRLNRRRTRADFDLMLGLRGGAQAAGLRNRGRNVGSFRHRRGSWRKGSGGRFVGSGG